ncbi:MAG: hypothetical protein JNL61_02150 [Rhizobiaceae bacterium]|nr:hypothetical protein [Rhizobiaceae bacterium]
MLVAAFVLPALLAFQPQASPLPFVAVGGCHMDVRTHFVPEYGLVMPHLHRRSDCAPIVAQGGGRVERNDRYRQRDCHSDVRRHEVNGVMMWHRHVGPDCAVRRSHKSTTIVP